jgi:hypothetical protein
MPVKFPVIVAGLEDNCSILSLSYLQYKLQKRRISYKNLVFWFVVIPPKIQSDRNKAK